jgi:hypothetical protein
MSAMNARKNAKERVDTKLSVHSGDIIPSSVSTAITVCSIMNIKHSATGRDECALPS